MTLLSALMRDREIWIGTPTELSEKIAPGKSAGATPKKIFQLIAQSAAALRKGGITAISRSSNGKWLIEIHHAESADAEGAKKVVPIAPAADEQLDGGGAAGGGETESSLWGGQASRPAIRYAQFRGAAPYPAPEGEKEA